MARSISHLKPGQNATLLFHGSRSYGNAAYTDENTLVRFEEKNGTEYAVFQFEDGGEWSAYKSDGRWCYGSSAEKVTVVS